MDFIVKNHKISLNNFLRNVFSLGDKEWEKIINSSSVEMDGIFVKEPVVSQIENVSQDDLNIANDILNDDSFLNDVTFWSDEKND